eukprot:scaffold109300_cov26-Tisochrysis_lutea.AAC.1
MEGAQNRPKGAYICGGIISPVFGRCTGTFDGLHLQDEGGEHQPLDFPNRSRRTCLVTRDRGCDLATS